MACLVLGAGVVWFGLYRVVNRPQPAVKLTAEDVALDTGAASTALAPPPYRPAPTISVPNDVRERALAFVAPPPSTTAPAPTPVLAVGPASRRVFASNPQGLPTTSDWGARETSSSGSDEATWRSRARQARLRLAALEAEVRDLDAKATRSAYGYGPPSSCRLPERIRDKEDEKKIEDCLKRVQNAPQAQAAARTAIMDRLATARAQLAEAQRALDNLADEARRANVPPGWLRE
jgi:hypothetical protein